MGLIGIIALIVVILLCLAGLVIIPLGAPGTWIIFVVAVIYDVIPGLTDISLTIIILLGGIALLGEALEYYIGARSAKQAGASKAGVAGAIIGGIIGAVVGVPVFLLGSLLGLLIGAFLGAFIVEIFVKGNIGKAFKAGIGAFKGRVGAILIKELLGIVMVVIILASIL